MRCRWINGWYVARHRTVHDCMPVRCQKLPAKVPLVLESNNIIYARTCAFGTASNYTSSVGDFVCVCVWGGGGSTWPFRCAHCTRCAGMQVLEWTFVKSPPVQSAAVRAFTMRVLTTRLHDTVPVHMK